MPPLVSQVSVSRWPIRPSLGVLGRKWALRIVRDLYVLREARFREILRRNPGMSERILSMRLRDLRKEGLIERVAHPGLSRHVSYRLSQRGISAVPVLEGLVLFGAMQLARDVFGPSGPPVPDRRGVHERKS